MATCETCKLQPGETNHPRGMIFIGWGRGWETCPDCNGSGNAPDPHAGDAARMTCGARAGGYEGPALTGAELAAAEREEAGL